MEVTEVMAYATAKVKEHLPHSDWRFTFNNRKTAFGVCYYNKKEIQLSYNSAVNETEDAVQQTVLHEIAHAIVGPGNGHNAKWKQVARSIGVRNPRAARRTTSNVAPVYKYVIKFKDEVVQGYHRRPSWKTIMGLEKMYVTGRKAETLGKLVLEQC